MRSAHPGLRGTLYSNEALQQSSFASDHDEKEPHRNLQANDNATLSIGSLFARTQPQDSNQSRAESVTDGSNTSAPSISPFIHTNPNRDESAGPFAVLWQFAPITTDAWSMINYNVYSDENFLAETAPVIGKQSASLSRVYVRNSSTAKQGFAGSIHALLETTNRVSSDHEPYVNIYYPIFEYMDRNSLPVAILSTTVFWKNYFVNVLPEGVKGVVCVVENSKGQTFTYRIDGPNATYLGFEDMHETKYDYMQLSGSFMDRHMGGESGHAHSDVPLDEDFMSYAVRIYPSAKLETSYRTSTPMVVSWSMVALLVLTALVFQLYDHYVSRRQNFVLAKAAKTDHIVASLFPETVRARVMGEDDENGDDGATKRGFGSGRSVASARSTGSGSIGQDHTTVIADFYPEATVLCEYFVSLFRYLASIASLTKSLCIAVTDIKGFTAWCSEREPSQVFILLETLYNTYDIIAKKRKVFKVETIGGKKTRRWCLQR
jgi:Adenylate and Guanylate cyclase catalytic domain